MTAPRRRPTRGREALQEDRHRQGVARSLGQPPHPDQEDAVAEARSAPGDRADRQLGQAVDPARVDPQPRSTLRRRRNGPVRRGGSRAPRPGLDRSGARAGRRNEVRHAPRQARPQAGPTPSPAAQAVQRFLRHEVECLPHGEAGGREGGQVRHRDRRAKKRDFRSLWIVRINAAAHAARALLQQADRRSEARRQRPQPQDARRISRARRPAAVRRARHLAKHALAKATPAKA